MAVAGAVRVPHAPAQDPAYRSARPPPGQTGVDSQCRLRPRRFGDTIAVTEPRETRTPVTTKDLEPTFWFCVDHHAVETFAGCGSHNRVGPFDSESGAARALDTIAERERGYQAEDAAWEG